MYIRLFCSRSSARHSTRPLALRNAPKTVRPRHPPASQAMWGARNKTEVIISEGVKRRNSLFTRREEKYSSILGRYAAQSLYDEPLVSGAGLAIIAGPRPFGKAGME